MLRETAVFDALVPSLLLYFLGAILAFAVIDRFADRAGIYRLMWHPALARLGLFVVAFSVLVLSARP